MWGAVDFLLTAIDDSIGRKKISCKGRKKKHVLYRAGGRLKAQNLRQTFQNPTFYKPYLG